MEVLARALCALSLLVTTVTPAFAQEKVNGVTVTKMKNLLTGKVTGKDMYGNEYGIDEKGSLGKAGEFRMLRQNLGTEKVDRVTVTKMKDLVSGTIIGTDMYGNEYGVDLKGKLGKAGELRMLRENIGTEKVNGVTVTKMKDLLTGKITGADMYGDTYVMKNGKLVKAE